MLVVSVKSCLSITINTNYTETAIALMHYAKRKHVRRIYSTEVLEDTNLQNSEYCWLRICWVSPKTYESDSSKYITLRSHIYVAWFRDAMRGRQFQDLRNLFETRVGVISSLSNNTVSGEPQTKWVATPINPQESDVDTGEQLNTRAVILRTVLKRGNLRTYNMI